MAGALQTAKRLFRIGFEHEKRVIRRLPGRSLRGDCDCKDQKVALQLHRGESLTATAERSFRIAPPLFAMPIPRWGLALQIPQGAKNFLKSRRDSLQR